MTQEQYKSVVNHLQFGEMAKFTSTPVSCLPSFWRLKLFYKDYLTAYFPVSFPVLLFTVSFVFILVLI